MLKSDRYSALMNDVLSTVEIEPSALNKYDKLSPFVIERKFSSIRLMSACKC